MGGMILKLSVGVGVVDTPLPTMKLCNNSSKPQAKEFSFNEHFNDNNQSKIIMQTIKGIYVSATID